MYLQNVISKKLKKKIEFFVDVLKVTDDNSRIRSADPYQNFMDPQNIEKKILPGQ